MEPNEGTVKKKPFFQSSIPLKTSSTSLKPMGSRDSRFGHMSMIPMPTTSRRPLGLTTGTADMMVAATTAKSMKPRIGSFSNTARLRAHPYLASGETSMFPQVVQRLKFDAIDANMSASNLTQSSIQSTEKCFESPSNDMKEKMLANKATSPSIDWNLITKEAQLIKAKTECSKLEEELKSANMICSQIKVDFETQINSLKNELKREKERNAELEKQIKCSQQKADDLSEQMDAARQEFNLEYEKFQKNTFDLQKLNTDLQIQLSDIQMQHESISIKHNAELMAFQHQAQVHQTEMMNIQQEKEVLVKQIEKLVSQVKETEGLSLKLLVTEEEMKKLKNQIEEYRDGVKLSDFMQNELQELKRVKEENKQLMRQNEILNDVHRENMILQEKIIGLEKQINKKQEELQETIKMDIECKNLRTRLSEWQDQLATDSPSRVARHIVELQQNEVLLRSEIGSLRLELNENTCNKTKSDCDLISVQAELNESKKKITEQNELIKRLNRKCLLFSKEKESYKRLIASYEHDITLDMNKISQDRIHSLESNIDEYRIIIEQLENDLKQVKDQTKISKYESELRQLRSEITRLTALNKQLESIERKTIPHDSYRVIHLKQNPLYENIENEHENYKKLLEENRRLTTRLQLIESGIDKNVSMKLDEGVKNAAEVEKLRQQLNSAKKKEQQIMEAFKKTSKEFREVCYMLTGYRFDALKQRIYRLSHVYADSPNDVLLFELEADGTLKLLENNYSGKLADLVHTYLTQYDSFPAFLSSLTLDLFNKQTHIAVGK